MNIVQTLQLNELQEFARKNFIPVVTDDTCNFLFSTVFELKPNRMLEIGTAIGYSGIVMLNASENAHLTTVELNTERHQMAQQNFANFHLTNRVTQINGDAKIVLEKLQGQQYDFVFLDGPKGQYKKHLPLLLPLLSKGGIIFCDNMNFHNLVTQEGTPPKKVRTIVKNLQEFKQMVEAHPQLSAQFYQIGDGVAILTKTV